MAKAKSPIDTVIEKLGGPTKAAAALGISNPSVVLNWRARKQVPADRVIEIEKLTDVSRHLLRPDVFGAEKASA
jgi:DNA-binding transcriptional regulator YdaS (Cro superfamily)